MTLDTYSVALCDNCVVVAANNDFSGVGPDDPAPLNLLGPTDHVVDFAEDHHFSHSDCEGCGGLPGDRTVCLVVIRASRRPSARSRGPNHYPVDRQRPRPVILTITIDLSNSAFDDHTVAEVRHVLDTAVAKLDDGEWLRVVREDGEEFWSRLKDSNGNAVGSITILTDPTDPKGPDHE